MLGHHHYIAGLLTLFITFQSCDKAHKIKEIETLPNILLIVSEDHGQDLGCYGNSVVRTPNIDFLASNGVTFENAYTTYSVCSPSRSSIFTGLYPHQNGQMGLATHKFRMYKPFKTIPVYLKSIGYRTGCLGKIHVNPESAIPFDFHELTSSNFEKKDLNSYAAKAVEFTKSEDSPYFLMVNYPDAHFPLLRQVEGMPKNPIEGGDVKETLPFLGVNTERLRDVTADYYNSIDRLDEAIGILLDSLHSVKKLKNTLIVFLSDHGAQFSRGKTTNYEGALKIPLIFYWSGHIKKGGKVKRNLVSTIDILPTILDAVQLKPDENLPGRSLLGLAQGRKEDDWRKYLFADGLGSTAMFFYPRRSVRGERYKLIYNLHAGREDPYYSVYTDHIYPEVISGTTSAEIMALETEMQEVYMRWKNPPEFELYDLLNDPWEFHELASNPRYKEELERMKTVLFSWQKDSRDPLFELQNLKMLEEEVDSVNKYFPNHSYQKNSDFQWRYPEYFREYVLGRSDSF